MAKSVDEKGEIADLVLKSLKPKKLKISREDIIGKIEIPPNSEMGDYAFPCFSLASAMKENPAEIALEIRGEMGSKTGIFRDVQTKGPYVNFFVNRKELTAGIISEILEEKEKFGSSQIGKGKTVLVEFSSPNIAKPFGIGHLRSTIIGNSLSQISEFCGFKTVRMNYLGDWGTQFGKLIAGYRHFGNGDKLKKNPIKHLLEVYVKINSSEEYEEESRDWFRKLEQGDKESLELWKKFRELSLEEFEKIYGELGIKFDVFSGESMYNGEMKEVLGNLKSKKLVKKDKGAEIVDLEKYGLGIALITKSDGSTLYMTRDLAAAISRKEKYNFDYMIYEVGQEQKLHFAQVFKILELMGYKWAGSCTHVEHGLYLGKDGKKFATRKGKTVFMEDIIRETKGLALEEIKKRNHGAEEPELDRRAMKVAIASIFYGDLKNNRKSDMVFDLKKFTSFEGDTGPYIQYSYARASSILRKAKKSPDSKPGSLNEKEIELIKKLGEFPEIVIKSYREFSPSYIANYAYRLSQLFNEFYHQHPVIGTKEEPFRLALVESFRQVIKNAFGLLGIDVLEEM